MIVYFNVLFLPKENVAISPDDRGFMFADGVYEVIHAYDGVAFKLDEHLQRLASNLRKLGIMQPDFNTLRTTPEMLLTFNNLQFTEATIYIQITRGVAPRSHTFPDNPVRPTVYAYTTQVAPNREKQERGVSIVLTPDIRWTRCDIKSLALLPNVLANQKAKEHNAEEALFIRNGVVTEGSHTNFFAVLNGDLVTHPANNYILEGITRKIVLELCFSLGIRFKETPIPAKDLYLASECMITGTLSGILPVVQVEDRQVADGKPGVITRRLQHAFFSMIHNK